MRVLVADGDAAFRDFACAVLQERGGHEVWLANDGQQALTSTVEMQPDVLLLDRGIPNIAIDQLCRTVRHHKAARDIHLIVTARSARREDRLVCLHAGVNDLLLKPIAPDELLARVALATHRHRNTGAAPAQVQQALFEATQEGSGEFVLRSGDTAARIYIHEHRVAWIQLADGSGTFLHHLALSLGLNRKTIREVVMESRRTGTKLSATLVAFGLLDHDGLTTQLRQWMAKKLMAILALPEPRYLFVPQRHEYADEILFTLEELGLAVPQTTSDNIAADESPTQLATPPTWTDAFVVANTPQESIEALLDRCMAIEGARGMVAVQRASGLCLGQRGEPLDADATWAQIQCFTTVSRLSAVQSSTITSDTTYHFIHPLPDSQDTLLYAVIDSTSGPLAMAQIRLRQAMLGTAPQGL